jgi:hypothetical protein
MNETRSVKKIFEGKLGLRGRGRPRLRWINDVEDDLRELSVKQWRTKALEREEWASTIKKAKTKLKGPWCYRKKKKMGHRAQSLLTGFVNTTTDSPIKWWNRSHTIFLFTN